MPKKASPGDGEPPPKFGKWDKMISRIRPQIFLAIICATTFSMFTAWLAYQMDAIEVMTAVIGGVFGFLGGVSLKVLENE
jgi:hypothetical protein